MLVARYLTLLYLSTLLFCSLPFSPLFFPDLDLNFEGSTIVNVKGHHDFTT